MRLIMHDYGNTLPWQLALINSQASLACRGVGDTIGEIM